MTDEKLLHLLQAFGMNAEDYESSSRDDLVNVIRSHSQRDLKVENQSLASRIDELESGNSDLELDRLRNENADYKRSAELNTKMINLGVHPKAQALVRDYMRSNNYNIVEGYVRDKDGRLAVSNGDYIGKFEDVVKYFSSLFDGKPQHTKSNNDTLEINMPGVGRKKLDMSFLKEIDKAATEMGVK